MATGLALRISNVVTVMRTLETNWATLDAANRCKAITDSVADQLTAIGVPTCTFDVSDLGASLNGQFDFASWTTKVSTAMATTASTATETDIRKTIAKLGDVIMHECRHCEQWFRMARLVAEKRPSGTLPNITKIAQTLGMPQNIVSSAVSKGPLSADERKEAEEWYDSVYGSGESFRNINVYGRNLNRTGTETGNQFQITEFVRYEQGLAEEKDAHAVGQAVQSQYLTTYGLSPQPLTGHQRPSTAGIQAF